MKTATFIIALLLTAGAYAQDKPKELSKDKQLEMRDLQVERLQARIAIDQAKAAYDDAVAKDQAAEGRMRKLVGDVCADAGLKPEECQVCDGPGPEGAPVEACKGLKPQELAVRKLVKPVEKAQAVKP
jgi:hypothetical protein